MEFSGELEDLPLIDLLQYLYAGKKTGTLMLSLPEEDWCVYFKSGEIIGADSPSSKRLLDLLVAYNQISTEIVEKTGVIKDENNEKKSVAQLLVEMALVSEENIKKIKLAEMKRRVSRLTTHRQGEFCFKNNQLIGLPGVDFDESDLLHANDVDTHLLFENILDSDERKKPLKHPGSKNIVQSAKDAEEETPDTLLEEVDHILSENKPVSGFGEDTLEFESDFEDEEALSPSENQSDSGNILILLVGDGIVKNLLREAIQNEQISVITPKTVEDGLEKAEQLINKGDMPFFLSDDRLPETRRFGPTVSDIILGKKKKSNWRSPVIVMTESSSPEKIWDFYQYGAHAVLPKPLRKDIEKHQFLLSIKKFGSAIQSMLDQIKFGPKNSNSPADTHDNAPESRIKAKPLH